MNQRAKKFLKKNNNKEKAISKENDEIYTDMIVYLRGSELTEYNQELVREDIIELILEGQQRGDNIQKVMGGRYKEICDEIIDVMPKKTIKDKRIEFISSCFAVLGVLGVISIIKNLVTDLLSKTPEFNLVLTVGDIIFIIAVMILSDRIVWFVSKTALDEKRRKNKKGEFLKVWFVLSLILSPILLSVIYLDTVVVRIPLLIAIGIVSIFFIISKVLDSKVY